MTVLDIITSGDGCWPDLGVERGFIQAHLVGVACLPHATAGGNPTVTVRLELPDGQVVLAETTLALFQMANLAFAARYGEARNRLP